MVTPFMPSSNTVPGNPPALGKAAFSDLGQPMSSRPCTLKRVPHLPSDYRTQGRSPLGSGPVPASEPPLSDCTQFPDLRSSVLTQPKYNDGVSPPQFVDLETLTNFERVTEQFLDQGIRFENAIALYPSNPAYPEANMDMIALMGAPKQGFMDTTFLQPIRQIEVCVTSSRPLAMTAFNGQNQVLTQTETKGNNLANHPRAMLDPHIRLGLQTKNALIHQVIFRCSGGNFTLSHFSFWL
ncbi:MAG: hypothetical protein VKJ64_20550 [Leptolyngbyaceae bacterium]|nr:hypothetical protein [Leptolyngbyaceae bacterium]